MDAEEVKRKLRTKRPTSPIPSRDFVSSGATTLNMAMTGRPRCGYAKGKYYLLVGDSGSGKTWFILSLLAEAAKNKHFANYRFIYDNGEDGALMDIAHYFGSEVLERLEPPAGTRDKPEFSERIEDLFYNVDDALKIAAKDNRPFIYIQDSMDVLSSDEEEAKFQKQKSAKKTNEATAGTMVDGKAKKNSSNIRRLLSRLRKTQSILIIINQTRDNLGFGAKFNPKTRSGGRALTFYATIELWTAVRERLTKPFKGKKRQIGILSQIKTKKNRVTGKDRQVEVPIYHSFGIDDVGGNIDYLLAEGWWSATKGVINAKDFDFKGKREVLVRKIEQDGLERDLQELVAECWNEIEDACVVKRKPRYE